MIIQNEGRFYSIDQNDLFDTIGQNEGRFYIIYKKPE